MSKSRPMLDCCGKPMDYCWYRGQYGRDVSGKRKLLYAGYWMFKCYVCRKEING